MSKKTLILVGVITLLLVNGAIFGTLYVVDMMRGPTAEEIAALEEAERQAAKDAIYAKLAPLPEFKSKANYIPNIGVAIGICEEKLHQSVKEHKSWQVNMTESRYKSDIETYLIVMVYETVASQNTESKRFKVSCEVSAEKKSIELWKPSPW